MNGIQEGTAQRETARVNPRGPKISRKPSKAINNIYLFFSAITTAAPALACNVELAKVSDPVNQPYTALP